LFEVPEGAGDRSREKVHGQIQLKQVHHTLSPTIKKLCVAPLDAVPTQMAKEEGQRSVHILSPTQTD
jgi:hypothetical protein